MRDMMVNVYLGLGAYQDGKTKKIKEWYLWIGGCLGIIFKIRDIFSDNFMFSDWVLCLIPGVLFLICAMVLKEKIGDGDGWILLILGNFLPPGNVWQHFYLSLFLLTIYALFLLILKKANHQTEIPYLPFLWMANSILWGMQYVG